MNNIEIEIAEGLKEIEKLKKDTRAIVAKAKEMNDADDIHRECKHGVMALDYCEESEANKIYQGDTTNEQMFNLSLRATEKLSRLNLNNIDINLDTRFRKDGLRFSITISKQKETGNFTFWFYLFWTFEKNFENLAKVLNTIEKNNYQLLTELKEELDL